MMISSEECLLFMNFYQGSLTSTSKGVLNIFKKVRDIIRGAKNTNKNENKDSIISMIYFDEMGLVEIPKSNPLKLFIPNQNMMKIRIKLHLLVYLIGY